MLLFTLSLRHRTAEITFSGIVWAFGLLAIAIGMLLVGLRGSIPDSLSIFVANLVLITGAGLRPNAVASLCGRKPFLWLPFLLSGFWAALWLLPAFREQVYLRVGFVNGAYLASALYIIWLCAFCNTARLVNARILGIIMSLEAVALLIAISHHTLEQYSSYAQSFQTHAMTVYLTLLLITTIGSTMCVAAMALERIQGRFHEQAMEDDLTGLPNRRALFKRGRQMLESKDNRKAPYAVILLDIDHFKSINDRLGHATGDEILRLFGRITKGLLPQGALAGRLGGEEFAIILPGALHRKAEITALDLAQAFTRESEAVLGNGNHATMSAGVLTTGISSSLDVSLKFADACLYLAKREGRNRIVSEDRSGQRAGATSTIATILDQDTGELQRLSIHAPPPTEEPVNFNKLSN
ncbi:diguanylate cyclase [Roseibium sp. RKSG952]|uniref:GGDEF domain-containing protein n=1 Tax=Roseibium sp. RKSG952 TaxID=2529384 RepID=UPI0018AD0EF4|nr:GGDEF domain-containing protein [Roseibium sp. RKSG952]